MATKKKKKERGKTESRGAAWWAEPPVCMLDSLQTTRQ